MGREIYSRLSVAVFSIGFLVSSAIAGDDPSAGTLLFRSGFEPDTCLEGESSGWIDIRGIDRTAPPPNDWENDFRKGSLGSFRFQYAGGDVSQRRVSLESDPNNSSNRVLRYWMRHVNVRPNASYGGKGRIQACIAGNKNLKNFYYRVRIFFHSDWQHLRDWDEEMGWFILSEFWNNANWTNEGYPFRIHVTVSNDAESDNALRFGVGAETYRDGWRRLWHKDNVEFEIPLEQWLTAEVYLQEGLGRDGRFYLAMTTEDDKKHVIFDVRDTTHHPNDPHPDGFTQFNPMKMYTHNKNIHRVRECGGALCIDWDDFELWVDRKP